MASRMEQRIPSTVARAMSSRVVSVVSPPDNAGGVGSVGGALPIEVGQEADAVRCRVGKPPRERFRGDD